MSFPWDVARDELVKLAAAGQSASQIGRALAALFHYPCSRNAVIGQLSRHRIPHAGVSERATAPRSMDLRSLPKPKPPPPRPRGAPSVPPPAPGPMLVELATDGLEPLAADLMALEAHTCRWPIGDGYCGRPAAGFRAAWCAPHEAQATKPPKRPFQPDRLADRQTRLDERGPVYRVW